MKNLFTKTDSRLHRNDNSRYRHISTRRLTLMLMAIAMMILAPNWSMAQNETYDFEYLGSHGFSLVSGERYLGIIASNQEVGSIYSGITGGNVTLNDAGYGNLAADGANRSHTSFDTRFASRIGVGKSWGIRTDKNYGLYYYGTTPELAIRNCWNGDGIKFYYSGTLTVKKSNLLRKANNDDLPGDFLSAGDVIESGTKYYAVNRVGEGYATDIIVEGVNGTRITKIEFYHGGQTANLQSSESDITLGYGQTHQTQWNNSSNKSTVVFTSSNSSVASVDPYTGLVTASNNPGTATITGYVAIGPEGNQWATYSEFSYKVNVITSTTTVNSYKFECYDANNVWQSWHRPDGNFAAQVQIGSQTYNIALLYFQNNSYFNGQVYYNHDRNRFGVIDEGWYLYRGNDIGAYASGLYYRHNANNSPSVTTFYVFDLKNGDKVKVNYGTLNNVNKPAIGSSNTSLPLGTSINSGQEFFMEDNSMLVLEISDGTWIESVEITHESGAPIFQFEQTEATAEIINLKFDEPGLVMSPAGAKVTYSSSNEKVVKIGNQDTGDLMFVNVGIATITATATFWDDTANNGQGGEVTLTTSYTVTAKADDAVWKVDGNTLYFPTTNKAGKKNNNNTGKLMPREVTAVPNITMDFGNAENTNLTLLRLYGSNRGTLIMDENGWEHVLCKADDSHTLIPEQGTFYKFAPGVDGELTIRGIRKHTENNPNSVILVDASSTNDNARQKFYPNGSSVGSATFAMENGQVVKSGDVVELTNNGNVLASLQFGELGGNVFSAATSSNNNGYGYYTAGNGTNGNVDYGTFYTIVPKYNGELELALKVNAGKKFYILENEIPMAGYNGKEYDENFTGVIKLQVEANTTYKVYCEGSKVAFWGCKFDGSFQYQSYPVVKELSFNGNTAQEEVVNLTAGHVYYLYANTAKTSSNSDWQVFYLTGFTFDNDFKFTSKGYVMEDDVNNNVMKTDLYEYIPKATTHTVQAVTYTGTGSNNITYTCIYKDNENNETKTSVTPGSAIDVSKPGAYVIRAEIAGGDGHKYHTYYVLTVPYSVPDPTTSPNADQEIVEWIFDRIGYDYDAGNIGEQSIENQNALYANADNHNAQWGLYYKVRLYSDDALKNLYYLNVPVIGNNMNIAGDNARYVDRTSGLLFAAKPLEWGTTGHAPDLTKIAYDANNPDHEGKQRYRLEDAEQKVYVADDGGAYITNPDPEGLDQALRQMLNLQPNQMVGNIDYITMYNGSSLTIPNLKAGQYIRIKWSRYSPNNGDYMKVENATDLLGNDMDGAYIHLGAAPSVDQNGGYAYHEFKVKEDGDVTFTLSQEGWNNFYEIAISNKFIKTYLRLATTTVTNPDRVKRTFVGKKNTLNVSQEYNTAWGTIRSQSPNTNSYSIKDNSRTGTLTTSNCSISNNSLSVTGGHGRFVLEQLGTDDGFVLDSANYVIKVYEYDYTQQTYPYTWDMTNINTSTGNNTLAEMTADAALTDDEDNHQYKYWTAPSGNDTDNYYTMNIGNPENLVGWRKKGDATQGLGQQDGSVIAELDGLGIVPVDLTDEANANIQFSSTGAGVRINGDGQQKIVVPGVDSGAKVYVAVSGGRITNAQDTEEAPAASLTKSIDASDASVYVIDGTGEDVELYLSEGAVVKKVAVTKTFKSFNNYDGKSYTTEVRDHNEKYDLSGYFTGKGVTAQTVGAYEPREEGSKSGTLTLNAVEVAPAYTPVILTCDTESPGSMPLFVKDVDTSESTVGTNYLVGNTGTSKIYAPKGSYILTNQYVPLDKDGNPTQTMPETGELAFYYVYADNKNGISPNKAYLKLSSSSGSGPNFIRAFYSFIGGDTTTEIGSLDEMDAVHEFTGPYYNLNGQKIDGKPTTKGIYIVNGKKVYVK